MLRMSRAIAFGATFITAWVGCVDARRDGIPESLLILEVGQKELEAGQTVQLALQVKDDAGEPLSDADIEIISTDSSRLTLSEFPIGRGVVSTEDTVKINGILLKGSVLVPLEVPLDAENGPATFIASVEGKRGVEPTVRWVDFSIRTVGGSGGVGGMGGENGKENSDVR